MNTSLFRYKLDQRLLRHLKYKGLVYLVEEKRIVFKYDLEDDRHDIDIRALTDGLGQYCALVQLISDEVRNDAILNIRVEAVKQGSFEVWLRLFEIGQVVIGTLIADNMLSSINGILAMFREYIELKLLLGSDKADRVEAGEGGMAVVVKGGINLSVHNLTLNLYTKSPDASGLLTAASQAILSDKHVRGVVMQDEGDGRSDLLRIDRHGLEKTAERNPYFVDETQTIRLNNVEMIVTGVNFVFSRVWRFVYKGQNITAKIVDEDFVHRVKNSEIRFGHGDILTVDVNIIQERRPDSPYWEDKSFVILKVKNVRAGGVLPEQET